MQNIFLTLTFFLLIISDVFSQPTISKIDSIKTLLTNSPQDTATINMFNNLSKEYLNINKYDSALFYANNALFVAKKSGWKKGEEQAYHRLGVIYWNQFEYAVALEYYLKSLKIREELGDKPGIASSYGNIGLIYAKQAEYPVAMSYYLKSLKIYEDLEDKHGMARSYHHLGIAYWNQSNYPKAMENYLKSLKIKEDLQDKRGMASSYHNIGIIYEEQSDYQMAIEYFLKSLKLFEDIGDKAGMASSNNSIGIIYKNQFNFPIALEYLLKSLKISEDIGDKSGMATSYNNIGFLYTDLTSQPDSVKEKFIELFYAQEQHIPTLNKINDIMLDSALALHYRSLAIDNELVDGYHLTFSLEGIADVMQIRKRYKEALAYYLQSAAVSDSIGAKLQYSLAAQGVSQSYKGLKRFEEALKWHELYTVLHDTVYNEENNKKIVRLEAKFDLEKKMAVMDAEYRKEMETQKILAEEKQKRSRIILWTVIAGLVLVILSSLILINRFLLIRKQKKTIEVEREKSEKLLLNILPKDTAEELKRNNAVTPKRYEMVTVMFTDFKGFTMLAEKMSAEELVAELDFVFKKFDEIISKYPIEKIKTIGDAYMCAGGLPITNTTNPMDVVNAALDIKKFMLNYKEQRISEGKPFFEIRIGIHTGPVVAGIVGDKKFAYDIWGDTVNTASRMESSGEAGMVNISGETYKLLQNSGDKIQNEELQFTFRGKVKAKNKGEIDMWFSERKIN